MNSRFNKKQIENREIFCVNHISRDNETKSKKIYKVNCNNRCCNIIEEDNTVYEVDCDCVNKYLGNK